MNSPAINPSPVAAAADTDVLIRRKPAIVVDRYALLRLQQSPSSQGGQLVEFLAHRSRAKCASTSSQF